MALHGGRWRSHSLFRIGHARRSTDRALTGAERSGAGCLVDPARFRTVLTAPRQGRDAVLAIIEVQDAGGHPSPASGSAPDMGCPPPAIERCLHELLEGEDAFCWEAGRLLVYLTRKGQPTVHQQLRRIATAIARVDRSPDRRSYVTPAIGYVPVAGEQNEEELFRKAEIALAAAKSSLEIEPFRYVKAADPEHQLRRLITPLSLWRRVPSSLGLAVQFALSLVFGFGAPFILYAICDALGSDISGPVYIGVVVVLMITATTIWIEGFLALRATEPPARPGAPAPVATVIIAAYLPNEAATIVETLEAFLRLRYANTVQIIIAYNSPFERMPVEDELDAIAARHAADGRFDIQPTRIHHSSSKAQNVNAAIGRVRGEFVGVFDADHHPLPDSIERAWRWLSNGWDVVQGRCSIRNGDDSWISRMVAIEFEQIYAVSHPGRARLHGFGIFGGSNGFWRTAVLHETRMRHAMLTEDIDSSIRAVERGYRIAGDRDLISEELAPTSLSQLLNQRLRWAQGWFQVSLRRIGPALVSPHVSVRQKLGLLHLLVWRELFPWYSIQVVPIMTYWVWIYGWAYLDWTIPVFVLTTVYTLSTGPAMVLFAYFLSRKSIRRRRGWFLEYLLVSTFFYAPFKDTLSRIAHIKEAMRERVWRVTPRRTAPARPRPALTAAMPLALLLVLVGIGLPTPSGAQIGVLIGGEASTIQAARSAARHGRNAEAAPLFAKAIRAVPGRRTELLPEYADALLYSGRSGAAAPLYRELLASPSMAAGDRVSLLRRFATASMWSGQYQVALAAYDRLLAQTPNDTESALRRARTLLALDRRDAAVAALDRIPASRWASGPLGGIADDLMVEAARAEAAAGQAPAAVRLFDRAMRHNPALKPGLLRDYAAQLASAGNSDAAITAYREVVENRAASVADRSEAVKSLARLYAKTGRSGEASKLYASINAAPPSPAGPAASPAPSRKSAILQRAQLLASLHQEEPALAAYREALAIDPRDGTARRGVIDETIGLARNAARLNRNSEAAALFIAAVDLDGTRPHDILREYADQLSFSGRAAEAIAIYREVLADPVQPAAARRQAMTGLANAYDWADRLEDAIALYGELERAYPDDTEVRWHRLVLAARRAAQASDNKRSAELFAQALALKPASPATVRRQYADQLAFTDRAAAAIDIYRAVLTGPGLSAGDRLRTRQGLARAYGWSGRPAEAIAIYKELAEQYPNDLPLRWQLLVAQAREAAQGDRNAAAAGLFAQAIKTQPARSAEIAREYADQLSFAGRPANAAILYRQILKQPDLAAKDRLVTEKALAQALDWAGDHGEAKLAYEELVRRFPDDVALRRSLLIVSARVAATADQNQVAADYLAKALAIDATKRYEILGEYADKLTFAHDAKGAIPLYRELLAMDRKPAEVRLHTLALARALAWNGQPMAGFAEYKRLVAIDPDDVEAAIGMARMLSWADRQGDAAAAFQAVLNRHPGNAIAMRGLAQAEDWQGHHRAAQSILARRLSANPNDLEARRLLAQSRVWSGRPDAALRQLNVALTQPPATRQPSRPSRTDVARNDDTRSAFAARSSQ